MWLCKSCINFKKISNELFLLNSNSDWKTKDYIYNDNIYKNEIKDKWLHINETEKYIMELK